MENQGKTNLCMLKNYKKKLNRWKEGSWGADFFASLRRSWFLTFQLYLWPPQELTLVLLRPKSSLPLRQGPGCMSQSVALALW